MVKIVRDPDIITNESVAKMFDLEADFLQGIIHETIRGAWWSWFSRFAPRIEERVKLLRKLSDELRRG